MKKKLLLISSLLLLTVTVFAQGPTFTSSYNPYVGFTGYSQVALNSGVTIGNTGKNQTWDYSSLVASGSVASTEYVAPSSTPYSSLFPSSNLASGSAQTEYAYYIANSNVFEIDGIVSPGVDTFYYTTPQVFFKYPFSYQTSYATNFAGYYTVSVETDNRTGTDSFNADGYGTLKLPNGNTFNNVLRITLIEDYNDYITIEGYPYDTVTERTYTVDYLTPGVNGTPLLSITYLSDISYPNTLYDTSVTYYPDAATGANDINPLVENLNVFPNPSYSQSTLSLNLKEASTVNVYITNMLGQHVRTIATQQADAGDHTYSFGTGDMAKGLYLVTVEVNGSVAGVSKLDIE